MSKCIKCGKDIEKDYRSESTKKDKRQPIEPRFCSRKCSNSRFFSEAIRNKISCSLKKSSEDQDRLPWNKGFGLLTSELKQFASSSKTNPRSLLDLSTRTVSKVLKRLNLPCSCCGFHVEGVCLDLHHITPKNKGGIDAPENLTYICPNCHRLAHSNMLDIKKLIPISIYIGENWRNYYYVK